MAPFNGGNISIARAALATVTLLIALMTWVGRNALEDIEAHEQANVVQDREIAQIKAVGDQQNAQFMAQFAEINRKLGLLLEERPITNRVGR